MLLEGTMDLIIIIIIIIIIILSYLRRIPERAKESYRYVCR